MNFLSICSGIEAASAAWTPLGFRPVGFAEIDKQPASVLAHHHPDVPNLGDFTTIRPDQHEPADLLVGGTPCQDFSVAGLGAGLEGDRGNLSLEFGRLASRERTRWLLWENVPGVLSSNDGRDFAAILGLLSGRKIRPPKEGWRSAGIIPGYRNAYGLAYRVLDAQFVRVDGFGRAVPQRRRRVFVVGYLGDWRRAAAVLFEPGSMRGDPAPRRRPQEGVARTLSASIGGCSAKEQQYTFVDGAGRALNPLDVPEIAWALQERDHKGADSDTKDGHLLVEAFGCRDSYPTAIGNISPTLRSMSEGESHQNGGGQVAIAFEARVARNGRGAPEDICPPLKAESGETGKGDAAPLVAFMPARTQALDGGVDSRFAKRDISDAVHTGTGSGNKAPVVAGFKPSHFTRGKDGAPDTVWPPLSADADKGDQDPVLLAGAVVRRLTPRECERLQGFTDDYTLVPYGKKLMADGPRYKMLGNSMAVNVMRWLGWRIQMVDSMVFLGGTI